MEEIYEEIKEAVRQLEVYKNRYRTINTQDVIDMLKRLNEDVKLTIPIVVKSFYCHNNKFGKYKKCFRQCDYCIKKD